LIDPERTECPECGGEITPGYGLAGGGMGPYQLCLDCGWIEKEQEPVKEEEN